MRSILQLDQNIWDKIRIFLQRYKTRSATKKDTRPN